MLKTLYLPKYIVEYIARNYVIRWNVKQVVVVFEMFVTQINMLKVSSFVRGNAFLATHILIGILAQE